MSILGVRRGLVAALVAGVVWVAAPVAVAETEEDAAEAPSAEDVLERAFRAALTDDLGGYLETIHPAKRGTERERDAIERYEWKRFVRQARWYLTREDPPEFEIVRRTGDGERQVRLFLQDQEHDDRMPTPVRFEKHQGAWYIVANSL